MSHEHERLSAYLDGELPPGERAEVEAHLGTCTACAARLASLAAVDGAFASLPAEAPEGYFESFPARVAARVRAETPRVSRRLPAWAWAAAAALVLAVVTPLTLRRPPGPAPAGVAEPKAADVGAPEGRAAASTVTPVAPRPAGGVATPAQTPAVAAPVQPPAREIAGALAAEPKLEPAPEEVRAREAVAPAALLDGTRPAAVPEEQAAVMDRFRAATTESMAPPGLAAPVPAHETAEAAFRRLDATRPRTAADWRALCDAWGAFAAAKPGSPPTDEVRVREVECLYEAWRAGGEAPDEEAFRAAARGYLARPDAAQRERVERLLR